MSDIFGWVTFQNIIDNANVAEGDSADPGQTYRKLQFAIDGYLELRLDALPAIKSVELPISHEIRAIVMPNNYYKFKSVGVMRHGRFHEFLPKDQVDFIEMECGVDERETGQHHDHNHHNRHYNGFYTIDIENKRILIDAPLQVQEVVLNYTPTGIRTDGQTFIPRMCEKVVRAYVENEMAVHDKGMNQFDKVAFQRRYDKEYSKFVGLQYDVDAMWMEYYSFIANNYKF
jgi:hypothetical protein